MSRRTSLVAACVSFASMAGLALADWNPGDPYKMHYPQLPDLAPTGLDVQGGPRSNPTGQWAYEYSLADDFMCTQSGPVTDIHVWGSFNQDIPIGAQPPRVSLSIYADVPASPTNPFSHPGALLWNSYRTPTTRLYATAQEGFYDPGLDQVVGSDTQVVQYNFNIPAAAAFNQTAGTIYWLGVHYSFDLDQNGQVDFDDYAILDSQAPGAWGWKTSRDHFNDDAVWTDINSFLVGDPNAVPGLNSPANWNELIYPAGHPMAGQSIDLAFVIGGVPEPTGASLLLGAGATATLRRRRPARR